MGIRHAGTEFSRVYCSDLQRSWRTAEIAFAHRCIPITRDPRLREIDYGLLTRTPALQLDAARGKYIETPFPGGESYCDVVRRTRAVLAAIQEPAILIGHRVTFYALEHLLRGVPLGETVAAPWHWRSGWVYTLGMNAATELITIYRSADMNAETDARTIRDLLTNAGMHPQLVDDAEPGVVAGTWEVRVPVAESNQAEALVSTVPQDDPGTPDPSDQLDFVTVASSDGSTGQMQAMNIQNVLQASGIDAVIVGDSVLPNLGFEVRVPKEDEQRARTVIEEAEAAGPAGAAEAERETEPQR